MQILRSLGPAVAHIPFVESVRAGIGALVGLGLTGLVLLSPNADLELGLYLVAPFGATSVLLFAIPNSPLAQPWSAIVGNTIAALIGVAACLWVSDPALRIALAVGLAITAMAIARAVHPPAGAVAMTAAMSPDAIEHLGFWFALAPIATGTIALVCIATIYARLTGRRYPFRQFDEPNRHGTGDRDPLERLGLTEDQLTDILGRYRQSLNLGAEDLARLIGAAELQAAGHRTGPLTSADIMSRELITVTPEAPLAEVATLFRQHKFTCLPVVTAGKKFKGAIFQRHLIAHAHDEAIRQRSGFLSSLRHLFGKGTPQTLHAGDIMNASSPFASRDTPIGTLLSILSESEVDAVPVLSDETIVGMVTRTDLMAALARESVRAKR